MRSRKVSTSDARLRRGFTLVEIVVVVTLIVLLAGLGLWVGMDVYRGYGFRSEARAFVSTLQRARLEAMVNMNEVPHGVHLEDSSYTVFQGAAYGADPVFNRRNSFLYRVTLVGNPALPRDVIFEQLSGRVSVPGTVTLTDGARSSTITIDHEGRISW